MIALLSALSFLMWRCQWSHGNVTLKSTILSSSLCRPDVYFLDFTAYVGDFNKYITYIFILSKQNHLVICLFLVK